MPPIFRKTKLAAANPAVNLPPARSLGALAMATLAVTAIMPVNPVLARPMTVEDVARLQAVGEIAVAPSGGRVLYTTSRLPDVTQGEPDGPATQQLWLAHGAGQSRVYLPDEMDIDDPAFSPDGRMITVLYTEKDGYEAIWGTPVDGGGPRKLAEVKGAHVLHYAWAPDSKSIYMIAEAAPDPERKARADAGFKAIVFEEDYRLNRLFVAKVGDSPDRSPRQIPVAGHITGIRVLPDGRKAVIEVAPTPSADDGYTRKKVALLDLASGDITRVIDTPGKLGDVELSPDGTRISLIAAVDRHDPAPTTLNIVDLATGVITPLNKDAPEAAVDAEWLPDGRLAAVIHVGTQSRYRVYGADGTMQREIDPHGLILTALRAAGGTVAAIANTPTHPNELFVQEGDNFIRWTKHNPWLAKIDFGLQKAVGYNARDGQRIEGIMIEPVGGVPTGGAPTILDVHGGPEAHESNGWVTNYSGPGQVAAGKGYVVFLPNYRGSTGYGTAFAKQHQGDYAGKEFNDLVDAVEALVKADATDRSRVGITGASYGGYATAWAATALSEYFAAGVMFVGISNQISKFGTTEIPNEMYLVHERKWPWENWDYMLERSPIFHAGKTKTPLLIMAGQDDTRVDPSQSHELYRAIKTRTKTPVRLVLYPGEGHGNRRAAARYDYNLRMMAWFDRYLRGVGPKDGTMPPARLDLPVKAPKK